MEDPTLKTNKATKEHICHILSIMIKKYNHSYGACVMITQTLSHYEHLSTIYSDLIQTCVNQLGYEAILPELLRELRHHLKTIESKTSNSKENPTIKFYSQFLIELAERVTPHLMNNLVLLMDYLDEESYLMRNSILFIIGEIIIKVLNEENIKNDLKLKQTRNELLDTLCEHIYDVNAITRSKTLQIWRKICDEKKLPLQYQNEIMRRCVGRMEDMASGVRKSAFQLLCDMIKKNPYGIRSLKSSIEEIEEQFKKETDLLNEIKAKKDTEDENAVAGADNDENQTKLVEQIVVQTTKVTYLKDMITFIKQIETAIPKLTQLLFSKTQTDVIEVISFFVTCYEHGLVDMLFGIRKMLSLILNSEKTIKDAVVDAYRKLYLDKNLLKQNPIHIVKQLIKLTTNLTICEYEALEQLIGELTDSGEIDNQLIQIMWEFFAQRSETNAITTEQSIGALILLSMIIKKLPSKGKVNIDTLIEFGLNIDEVNLVKIKQTCIAISNICSNANTKQLDLAEPYKLDNSHILFDKLSEVIVKNFTNLQTIHWIPMSECALTCIYRLADNPLIISESLLLRLIELIKPLNKYLKGKPDTGNTDVSINGVEETLADADEDCDSLLLTRFMSFVGFISMKFLIFLNTSVVCELKRRKTIKENNEIANNNNKKNNNNKNKQKSAARKSHARRSTATMSSTDMDLQEEMGLQGADAEDAEQVFVEHILETKVSVNSLLSKFTHIAVLVLKEPSKYGDEKLQLACVMALMRYMCLSRRTCVANLQLIFTIMEKLDSELVRSQLILGIGDLIYRFPNELDPWTPHLYSPLRDRSILVRTNTIRLLSHLILKEQIKTKGQLYEIAICTIDDDLKIATLSKLFFQEYSKRNNGLAIYNILPDIISHLTNCADKDRVNTLTQQTQSQAKSRNDEPIISEESFRQIVSYLFSFIKKDKQCETLIEKLAHSFKHGNTERKCRDLAFCLTKININDSGVKKLFETYKHYEDKLCIEDVCEMFRVIIKNAKKIVTLKIETKKIIEEFEKKIEETLNKGLNDGNNENAAPGNNSMMQQSVLGNNRSVRKVTTNSNVNKKKKPLTQRNNKKKQVKSSSDEEDVFSDSD
jgi:condensin complex subunit 1